MKSTRKIVFMLAIAVGLTVFAAGCFCVDLLLVKRDTALFYILMLAGLAALTALIIGMIVEVALPLRALERVASGEEAITRTPRLGIIPEDIIRLSALIKTKVEKERAIEALKKEAELNALRSQINPHFLYNTLDSIRGQLMILEAFEAADIVESLSNLFRYSINPRTVYNTLEQELDNVQDYMRIMRFRLGDRLRFDIKIASDSEYILNCEMPKLTLQPILENAVLHGFEHKPGLVRITLRAQAENDGLSILVSDDGAGIPAKRLDELNASLREGFSPEKEQSSGVALVNVNERIRILYGGSPYGLHVSSDVGIGTQVHVLLPVRLRPPESRKESEL